MKFLGRVLATIVGLFLFFMILFFGIMIIGVIFSSGTDKVSVKTNSVIELNMEKISADYTGKFSDPIVALLNGGKSTGFISVLNAIENASTDDKIKGIILLNNHSQLGLAQIKALRNSLLEFKKSGKFIVSYADYYTQKEYYLSSLSDTIYMNPIGELDLKGLSTEIMFFKNIQEKTGIKMEVLRHGQFKSAVEPFLDNKMSEANRLQTSTLLFSVWDEFANDISKSRNIDVEQINNIATDLLGRTPEMAKAQRLIDKIAYEDEFHNGIKTALNIPADKDYNKISITDYAQKVGNTIHKGKTTSDKIAVIYAQGEIKQGKGDPTYIGEESMRKALKEARENKNIKSVVLRIDSPGGSALTSDLIWREIELTKKIKPVVVSMGNLAASGGYYIACNADKIFAEPTTITGSIGVFGMLPNLTEFSKNIGISTEQVNTHKNSAGYSPFQPLSENYKKVTLESIENIYSTFVNRVATGRNMTFEAVDAIGQGRIWSGTDAKKIGLVDEIGGLKDALQEAAKLAGINDYKTQDLPNFDQSLEDFFGNTAISTMIDSKIESEIGKENYKTLQQVKQYSQKEGTLMLMPYTIKID